jgi:hypothetical protein
LPPLPEILGRLSRIAAKPHIDADDAWTGLLAAMNGVLRSGVAKAHAVDEARLNKGWALLHEAAGRCCLLDQRTAERRE